MKDIISTKKKAIKTSDIVYIYAPHYPALTIDKVLEFSNNYHGVVDYLPHPKDIAALPRQVSLFLFK